MAARNPVAKFNRVVNRPQVEVDRTKYKRTQKEPNRVLDNNK